MTQLQLVNKSLGNFFLSHQKRNFLKAFTNGTSAAMLLKREVEFIFRVFRVACTCGFLPVQVNVSWAELVPLSSWKYKFWFLVFLLNGIHKIVSFVRTCLSDEETPLHQLVLHFMLVVAAPMYSHWYFLMFIKYPDEFRSIFKMTMTGTMKGNSPVKSRQFFNYY